MLRRLLWFIVLALILAPICPAFAQEASAAPVPPAGSGGIKLQYKFTPGLVLRYKMVMDITVNLGDLPNGGKMPSTSTRSVGIVKQKVLEILPDGDAKLAGIIVSMKLVMKGTTKDIPVSQFPTFTTVMSPDGQVKSMSGFDKMPGMQFMNIGNIGQCAVILPRNPVNVGDTWTQETPSPLGSGTMKVESTLLNPNSKVGNYIVATIGQKASIDIDMNIPGAPPKSETAPAMPKMNMTGTVLMNVTVYFSSELGRMIRSTMSGNAQFKVDIPGASEGIKTMTVDEAIKFDMFLLPSATGK